MSPLYRLVPVLVLLASSSAVAQNFSVGTTGMGEFDALIGMVIRIIQVLFILGGFIYVGMAGLAKAKGEMDANDRIKNAGIGAAIAIGAPILLEFFKGILGA